MGRKNSTTKKNKKQAGKDIFYTGTMDITRSGMGYVIIPGEEEDIMVRASDFNQAMHGDTVRVRLHHGNGRRKQGVISDIVKRKRTDFIGHIELSKDFAFFIADYEKQMPDFFIPLANINDAKNGQRVVARMVKWNKGDKRPVGEIITILEDESINDTTMRAILMDGNFPLVFSEQALEEAARLPDDITPYEVAQRKDLRGILTFTIDPHDAKDFDDAISFKKVKNNLYEIGVHIADVSHYVHAGTQLDAEAYERATSVYLPDRVNPMLPEVISNELCSLRPNEDKLTFSAIFLMDHKGEIKQHWLGKTAIHSQRRFTYEEVQSIIETKEGDHAQEILLLNDMAQRIRKKRFEKGAINFSSQEVRFVLNEEGDPIAVTIKESKEAHQLIEEFMLLANKYVAQDVSKIKMGDKPYPFPYRVHDKPDEEKLLPFMVFAKKFGYKFDITSPDAIRNSFNNMLELAQGKPEQHVLEQLGIRTMAKAVYTTENIGHYGLGFEHYCHFTSPIRRYPDVMVHRILFDILQKKQNPPKKMEEACKHCSERERAAMEAERTGNKFKQVQFMSRYVGEDFTGVISGVASFGFWVETIDHKCEGLISIAGLSLHDDFRYVDTDYSLQGMRTGLRFRIGDKVTIKVVAANLDKKQLDYEWVKTPQENEEEAPPKKKLKKNKI